MCSLLFCYCCKIAIVNLLSDMLLYSVLARDSGSPMLSSMTSVVFRVLDENDHAPKFILPVSEVQILENQEPSTIYTFQAVDQDATSNGTVQYQIIGKVKFHCICTFIICYLAP